MRVKCSSLWRSHIETWSRQTKTDQDTAFVFLACSFPLGNAALYHDIGEIHKEYQFQSMVAQGILLSEFLLERSDHLVGSLPNWSMLCWQWRGPWQIGQVAASVGCPDVGTGRELARRKRSRSCCVIGLTWLNCLTLFEPNLAKTISYLRLSFFNRFNSKQFLFDRLACTSFSSPRFEQTA